VATPRDAQGDTRRLERLLAVGRGVVAELDLETVLHQVLDAAREITGARYAALGILDEDRRGLARFLTTGIDDEAHAAIGDLPRGRGVLGVLIDDPRPLRLADVGAHPHSYGFPAGHPPMRSFLGVPILVRGEAWGNLYLTEKEGGSFTREDEEAVVILADWAAIAIGNARLYHDVASRRDELERTVRALEATTEISRALGGETELERILELVVKRARALVGARSALIALAERDEMVVVKAVGEISPDVVGFRVPLDDSVTGLVLRRRRSERLADVRNRVNFRLARHTDARTGLIVPLLFRDRGLGVLAVFDRVAGGDEFRPEEQRLVEAFASSAAAAVATAQDVASEALRRSLRASEEERRRWARELHDQTLQDLGALRVFLSTARRGEDPGQLQAAMGEAVEALSRGIRDLRALITDLRPASLDELGLVAAVEGLAERTATQHGLEISVEFDARDGRGERIDAELEDTAYRVVQEALTNVVKHAGARSIRLRLDRRPEALEIAVADDGAGFDPRADAAGFGLVGMGERVALVGGSLDVRSEPGHGTRITAILPCGPAAGTTAARAAGG
jgi:signal transduction histidine kinase